MKKYPALALTISLAIPLGLYLLLPANIWLVILFPRIYANLLFYVIFWYSLALVADFIVSMVLFLLLTEKPFLEAILSLLSLIMAGIVWSHLLHQSRGISFGIWDSAMVLLIGFILLFSVLEVPKKDE